MNQVKELIGEVIGNYKLIEYLGGGGMSEGVYRAQHVKLENDVAIKVMDIGAGTTADRRKRIMEEPRRTASLTHPNIVRIIDVLEEGPRLYMVMDYIKGKTLFDILRDERETTLQKALPKEGEFIPSPMPNQTVASIIRQIGRALDFAHNHGLIHRDVKPANILVTEEGHAVLTDFGIAKALEATELSVTREGVGVGTPPYMSPEQIRGAELTEASDEYSLAVVAYQMLTGRIPFEGDSSMVIAHKHLSEPPPPARLINPAITKQTEQVLNKALSKNPKDRYGHPGTFTAKLAETLVGSTKELDMPTLSFSQRLQGSRSWGALFTFWRFVRSMTVGCLSILVRSIIYIIIGLALFIGILGTGSVFLVSRFAEEQIASAQWGFNEAAVNGTMTLGKDQMINGLNRTMQLYLPGTLENLALQFAPPSKIAITGSVLGRPFSADTYLFLSDGYPTVLISSINGQSVLVVFNILSGGVNRGFVRALDNSGAKMSQIQLQPDAVIISLTAPQTNAAAISQQPLAEGIVLDDSFTDLESGWPRSYSVEAAHLEYQGGRYRIDVKQPNFQVIQDYPRTVQNFDLTVDASLEGGQPATTEYGIAFARQDANNYLAVVLTGDGFLALKSFVAGQETILFGWQHIDAVADAKGAPVQIAVNADGKNITIFIQGDQIGSAPLPSSFSGGGYFGFYVRTSEASPATVYYDNLKITAK